MKDIMIRAANIPFKIDTCPTAGTVNSWTNHKTWSGKQLWQVGFHQTECYWHSRKLRPTKLRRSQNSQVFYIKGVGGGGGYEILVF